MDLILKQAQSHYQRQEWSQAEDCARKILATSPDHAKALEMLALIAFECDYAEQAFVLFEQASNAAPHDPLIWYNRGQCYLRQIQLPEALYALSQSCQLNPDFAAAHNLRGVVLQELNRPTEAIQALEQAAMLQPSPEVQYNLAVAYRKQERFSEALKATANVLNSHPKHADAYNNRALIRQEMGQFSKAREDLLNALQLEPGNGEAHFNLGCLDILENQLPKAWENYEWRWYKNSQKPSHYKGKPIWQKDNALTSQDVLYVHADAGFGDSLQFARYLLNMFNQGCRNKVYFACQKPLLSLFKAQQWPFEIILLSEGVPEDVTLTVPLLSLPYHHQTTAENTPCTSAYLKVSDTSKKSVSEALDLSSYRKKIGITWSGSPDNSINNKRSCDFKHFLKLIRAFPDIAWVSLQKDVTPVLPEDQKLPENLWLMGDTLSDFADTAQWIDALDLIISVDTSLVHLAGAMGKPTWTLLSFVPDWRWFAENNPDYKESTPWYENTRLFRQKKRGQWKDPFWQVKKELEVHS